MDCATDIDSACDIDLDIEGLSLIDFEIDADNDLLASNDAVVDNLCEFEISLFNVLSDSEIDSDNDLLASNDAVVDNLCEFEIALLIDADSLCDILCDVEID